RPDGRAALGNLDGIMREWRRLLPLFVFGRARLRPDRSRRHLRARLSADGRGAALRDPAAAEQDLAHQHDRALMATKLETLAAALQAAVPDALKGVTVDRGEITVVVPAPGLPDLMRELRDRPELRFEMLVDVCGVDYSTYGDGVW